jgi:hypothetical protein
MRMELLIHFNLKKLIYIAIGFPHFFYTNWLLIFVEVTITKYNLYLLKELFKELLSRQIQ